MKISFSFDLTKFISYFKPRLYAGSIHTDFSHVWRAHNYQAAKVIKVCDLTADLSQEHLKITGAGGLYPSTYIMKMIVGDKLLFIEMKRVQIKK